MRILDTVVLIASADPDHPLHKRASDHLQMVHGGSDQQYMVPSSVILELDLELKTHGFSPNEREVFHKDLSAVIPDENILPLTPKILGMAVGIEKLGYFDSLLVAAAMDAEAEIVTTDGAIRSMEDIKSIW